MKNKNKASFKIAGSIVALFTGLCAHAQTGNTATGYQALSSITTGSDNTADGYQALLSDNSGRYNTAMGYLALSSTTTGADNTAVGLASLSLNTVGFANTAFGMGTLTYNTNGTNNVAVGFETLYSNTVGTDDVGIGDSALYSNIRGENNTAAGNYALHANTTGNFNTAIGSNALQNTTTGSSNLALGIGAGEFVVAGSNNIEIFDAGSASDANTIRIGTQGTQSQTFVAGIAGVGVTGSPVVVGSNGQLGVAPSSERFKVGIHDMASASEAILALRPVTFRYKPEIDPKGTPQFGLVAEEVEKISPDLVTHDAKGQIFTVRYDAVNAMLLNEFRKQHDRVEGQAKTISEQQGEITALTARLDALEKATANK